MYWKERRKYNATYSRLFHIPFPQLYESLVSAEDFLPVSSLFMLSIENILESLETDDIKKQF